MVQFLECLAREVISLKDIHSNLCPKSIDQTFQSVRPLGQCDSLLIEILREPLMKVLDVPSQPQEFVFEIQRYTDGPAFLRR
jgi:hypothetical protein